MKRRIILVSVIFATLIIAAGVILYENVVPANHSDGAVIVDHWVNKESCSPPCWEGITPRMPASEALAILQKIPQVMNLRVHDDHKLERGEISWNWSDISTSGRLFYTGNSVSSGDVYAILPGFECCIRLGQLVASFGPPDNAYTTKVEWHDQTQYLYTLVWLTKGFSAKGYPFVGTKIDENFLIDTIEFFEPSMEGFLFLEGNSGKNIVPWHGYDDGLNYLSP